jgi:hypothetical protein
MPCTLARTPGHSDYENSAKKEGWMVQKQATVSGKITNYKIDVGLVNGKFYAGAFALSFATSQAEKQWKDTDAVAFAIETWTCPATRWQ